MKHAMKKLNSLVIACSALAMGALIQPGAKADTVGVSGYTNSFATLPAATDWSTLSIAGAQADATTPGQIDTEVQAVAASSITSQAVADATLPPAFNASATWSSAGFYLQTRPTGNRVTFLMCTLVNGLG